jgi:hypothetical protein
LIDNPSFVVADSNATALSDVSTTLLAEVAQDAAVSPTVVDSIVVSSNQSIDNTRTR